MKLAVLLFAAALFLTIGYYKSEYIQSNFYYVENGGVSLFIDKYVARERRAEFISGIEAATKGSLESLGIRIRARGIPRAYIAANELIADTLSSRDGNYVFLNITLS